MSKFDQKTVRLTEKKSDHRIKVSKLMSLLENHPYRVQVEKSFQTKSIEGEFITIDYVDVLFKEIKRLIEEYRRFNIKAQTKDISLVEYTKEVEGISGTPIKFIFDRYKDSQGDELDDLHAFAIHDSRNMFLNEYDMAKYANRLYKDQHYGLVRQNVEYFRSLAAQSAKTNRLRSYRLIEHGNELFVRGITSVNQYNEYGIDFAFVTAILMFHEMIKSNSGDSYGISSAALSVSKLEMVINDKNLKEAKGFGKVSSSTIISTNDLGNASFKFLNIVKVGILDARGVYIYSTPHRDYKNEAIITHNTKAVNALSAVQEAKSIIRSSEEFIAELEAIKGISTPDDLRSRILLKLEAINSPFRKIKSVRDLFKPIIANKIENFSKLLEMCRKAEELDINYDLKEKLRVIMSDIIINKRSNN